MSQTDPLKEFALKELIAASAVSSIRAIGEVGGYWVRVTCNTGDRPLAATRGGHRMFASLDTLSAYLKRLGICEFDVDASNYQHSRLRRPRPDRARP